MFRILKILNNIFNDPSSRPLREKSVLRAQKRSVAQFLRRNVDLFQKKIALKSVVR